MQKMALLQNGGNASDYAKDMIAPYYAKDRTASDYAKYGPA